MWALKFMVLAPESIQQEHISTRSMTLSYKRDLNLYSVDCSLHNKENMLSVSFFAKDRESVWSVRLNSGKTCPFLFSLPPPGGRWGYGSHGRVTVKPSTAASCRSNRGRERGEGVGRRMATVQCTKCTAERKGFRRELDSWRHRLIHCVGMIHVQFIFWQKSASFREIFARVQRDRCPELSQIAS